VREFKIENNNGGIRVQFQVSGKRYNLTPVRGGKFDNPADMAKASTVIEFVKKDLDDGNFDATLKRYGKRQSIKETRTNLAKIDRELEIAAQNELKPDLKDLWGKYSEFKRPQVKPSTFKQDYENRIGKLLPHLPTTDVREAIAIRDWIVANKPPISAKKILTQFSACCNWAVDSELLEFNPFVNMAGKIRKPPKREIAVFSTEERDLIIEAFKNSKYYSHYTNLVKFLFFSGCRPCEAIPLTWQDFKGRKLTLNKTYVYGELQKDLKTQEKRVLNLNDQVIAILDAEKSRGLGFNLIFPSPRGNYIDWHNFTNKAWRSVLSTLPIEYRNPYAERATYITEARKKGVGYGELSKHCGNSPETILHSYEGINSEVVMPEI